MTLTEEILIEKILERHAVELYTQWQQTFNELDDCLDILDGLRCGELDFADDVLDYVDAILDTEYPTISDIALSYIV